LIKTAINGATELIETTSKKLTITIKNMIDTNCFLRLWLISVQSWSNKLIVNGLVILEKYANFKNY
jgi:hypothetical protein